MLLLDVGNTRVKAGCADSSTAEPCGYAQHRGVVMGAVLEDLDLPNRGVDRIVACCVAGDEVREGLAEALQTRFCIEAEFITATREACGVTNSYPEPRRLGADRWAALIGAQARGLDAACIVDAGSALTIDGLAGGRHLGGLIIPGAEMMQNALFEKTGDLRSLSEAPLTGGRELFANDTREAITRGAMVALASAVRHARRELAAQIGQAPTVVVAGGDAERLLALLDDEVVHAPHLILEGLAALARAHDQLG
jgi:type III pantothenate kinase